MRVNPPGQPDVIGEIVITVYNTDPVQAAVTSVTAADKHLTTTEVEQSALKTLQARHEH